MTNRTAPVV